MNLGLFNIPVFNSPYKEGKVAVGFNSSDEPLDVLLHNQGDQVAGVPVIFQLLCDVARMILIADRETHCSENDEDQDESQGEAPAFHKPGMS